MVVCAVTCEPVSPIAAAIFSIFQHSRSLVGLSGKFRPVSASENCVPGIRPSSAAAHESHCGVASLRVSDLLRIYHGWFSVGDLEVHLAVPERFRCKAKSLQITFFKLALGSGH